MIASNYRKHPEAAALQMCLPFGKPRWNGARPTTRAGRAIRAAQAALIAATPQLTAWTVKAIPQWAKDQAKRAKALAAKVKQSIETLAWNLTIKPRAAWPLTIEAKVARLIEGYQDEHHGNEAHPLARPMWHGARWYHIPSGTHIVQLNRRYRANPWPAKIA